MRRTFFTLVALVAASLASACDPQAAPAPAKGAEDGGSKSEPAPSAPGSPAGGDATKDSPTPVFAGIADCLESCDRADVISTNRETCKLNCDAAYGATAAKPDALGQAASCLGRCYASDGSPDACVGECKAAAAGAQPPVAADVLERLGTCVSTCHADKGVRPTNQATCELNCAQAGRVAGTPPPGATPPASR